MDLEAITCGICKNEYNLTNRLPRLMMNCCGESVCTDCIRRILQSQSEFRCPYDNTPYIILDGDAEAFVINPTLKRLLEKRAEKEKCPEHKDEFRFKCLNCQRNVCDVCIHSGKHKGHDLISLKQAQSEASRKQKELELKLEDLSSTYKGIDTALKKSESEFLETLHMRFKEIRERVDNTERRLGIEINKFFEVERTAVKNNLGPESALRRTTIDTVEYLKRSKTKELPELKKQDISQILISLNAIISQNQAQVYAQTGKRYLNAFDSSLMHATDALSKLEFPTREFAKKFESYTIIETPPKIAVGNTSPPHTTNNNVSAFPAVIPTVTVRDPMHIEINHAFRVVIKNNSIMYLTAKKIFVKTEPSADLGLEVEKWGKINKLKIRLESDMASDDKLEALGYICSRLDELKRIEMICVPEGLNEEHYLKFFSKIIQKPKNLQEIDFNFKRCKINDKNMNTLTDAYISRMKELDIIRLNLASTFVTHVSIRNLMAKLHPVMKHLVEFELDLTKTKYEDLNDAPLFGDLKNLKRFALILYFTKMTDVGLEAFLGSTINSMKTIQDFSLDLSGTIASQVTLSHLLVAMPTIKSFELRLSNTKTTDKDLKLFTNKPLASMKHLEDLSLDLRETQVTDLSVGELIAHIPKVKSLKLMLGSLRISDINLHGLGTKLNTMKSLVTFELDLENAKVAEEGITRIFVILPNLQNFSLNLAETGITDQGLKIFVEKSLVYMKSLRSFSMNLSKTRVGDQSINSLLTQMKSVNSFKLYLQGTEISDRGVETFVKNIKKILKSLEEFEMDLTNTNVSSMILMEIKEVKKQLSQNALSY